MVLVLFTITAITSLLVGLVNDLTKGAIEQTKKESENLAKFEVLGTSASVAEITRDTSRRIGGYEVIVSTVSKKGSGEVIGYAVNALNILPSKPGYNGNIRLMVGFKEQGDSTYINAVSVLSQSETPGLGANMTKPGNNLERSILKKNPARLIYKVSKEGGSFDALTGSTISSRAYANAVETAYAGYLWANNKLDMSEEAINAAPSGASSTKDGGQQSTYGAVEIETVVVDGNSGATPTEKNSENKSEENKEPAAQEGGLNV